jgi:hypothetical protein
VNSNLYNKTIPLPKEMVEYLQTCFDEIPNSDSSIEGHKRNEELRNSGYVTYQQLGRIKNYFDNYGGDKTDAPFILNGGDTMRAWVDRSLESLRNGDSLDKQIKRDYTTHEIDKELTKDLGWLADVPSAPNPSKDHYGPVDSLKITEDLNRINDLIKKII